MREIILDTETTGLSPASGHRIVEIGCVEVIHGKPTGQTFQHYINPNRDMPIEAERIHGLSASFLKDFPSFQDVHHLFLEFIQDSPLVIHNARFDMTFLNAELSLLGKPQLTNPVTDTLVLAKSRFPGMPASLDALCKRYQVNLESRTFHGALLDAHLLASVYQMLRGSSTLQWDGHSQTQNTGPRSRTARARRAFSPTPQEQQDYDRMMQALRGQI
jgi:DNA polymerase III subunit epsilon